MHIANQAVFAARNMVGNAFNPAQESRIEEAANKVKNFFGDYIAKAFTQSLPAKNFGEEITRDIYFTQMLGGLLADSVIGTTLKENISGDLTRYSLSMDSESSANKA